MKPGDIVSYLDMCREEGASLQRGMNFRLRGGMSVILMSLRTGAPYSDTVSDGGTVLTYEGHDAARERGGVDPKRLDQPLRTSGGSPTQNSQFFQAAQKARAGGAPELVKVYEKLRSGIWSYNGVFRLTDAWQEKSGRRKVYKFRLEIMETEADAHLPAKSDLVHERVIPTSVKLAVWKRDKGRCIQCGKTDNLHFDHVIPFSKGGSSLVSENIQLLCARHNLAKHDRIE